MSSSTTDRPSGTFKGSCPQCGDPFDYAPAMRLDGGDDGLTRVLSENDPLHICGSCSSRIQIHSAFLFSDRSVGIFAAVGTDLRSALVAWRENGRDWPPDAFCSFSNRLALKYAILRRVSFTSRLCSIVPISDRLVIAAHWLADEIPQTTPASLLNLLGERAAEIIAEAFGQAVANRSPFQARFRRLARRLKLGGLDLGIPHAPEDELPDLNLAVVRSFASAPPDRWDKLFEDHISVLEPLAIEICWHSSRDYRRQPGGGLSAIAVSHLANYFAGRIGSAYEQAESMYELGAAQLAIGQYDAAERTLQRALELYLDGPTRQQPLECLKLLADLNLLDHRNPPEAARWGRTAVEVAKLWSLPAFIPPIMASLARAAQLSGDLDLARAHAEEAIAGATQDAEGRQIRVVAADVLRDLHRIRRDDRGVASAVRTIFDEFSAASDWGAMSQIAENLVGDALGAGEFELANAIMTAVLAHLPNTKPSAMSFQADEPMLRISGGYDALDPVRIWHLGGTTAQLTRQFNDARQRFATATDLAREAGNRESLRQTLVAWAACLCELASFDEAKALYARAIDAAFTPAERAVTAAEGASHLLQMISHGVIFSDSGEILPFSDEMQAKVARTAVDLFDAAVPDFQAAEFSLDRRRDLQWLESHARALDAWTTRRGGAAPEDAIARAREALRIAENIPDPVASLETLDVLYFAYRDTGHVQLAAQILCRAAEAFVSAISVNVDKASFLRWIENEAHLPGVDIPLHPDKTPYFQSPYEDFKRWRFNAIRSPSLGMLAVRENASSFSPAQIDQLARSDTFWVPRNLGTFRNLEPEAIEWQMASIARGGSSYIGAERWVDQLASGYLLLSALSGPRPSWLSEIEHIKLAQRGYFVIGGSLALLGLYRLALEHCPRPPSCEQPSSPASRLVPLTPDVADAFDLWNLAGGCALECGETDLAFAIAVDGIRCAERRENWAEVIQFRLIKAQCHRKRMEAFDRDEYQLCLSLLGRVSEASMHQNLSVMVERLGDSLGPDDLRSRERNLIISEALRPEGRPTEDQPDFDEELDRLLSAFHAYLSLGHLYKASGCLTAADDLVRRSGAVSARPQVLRDRAVLASASGDPTAAVRFAEESLAILEALPEPNLHDLGVALGSVGLYRITALERAKLELSVLSESSDFTRAVEVLERSLEIHRKLGERRDVMVNLINLSMAHGLRWDAINQLKCCLDALRLCADFDLSSGPTILYPTSCITIWTNVISVCNLLGWRSEALLAADLCLDLVSGQLSSLILEDNKLMSLPERDRIERFALRTRWQIVDGRPMEPIEADLPKEAREIVRVLRSALVAMFESYAVHATEEKQSVGDLGNAADDAGKPKLRRDLWERVENAKSRILREHLRNALQPPSSLPTELRERESAAFVAWQDASRRLHYRDDFNDLKTAIQEERAAHVNLRSVWTEIETIGGDAAEYSSLRAGRSASFETVRSCLGEVAS